jgi:hypothetical protein
MPELKVKTQGAGSYDQSIIDAERVLQELKDQEGYAKTLDEFDITDRKKNAEGGIMSTRAKFKSGKVKLAQFFYAKGTDLVTEIRKAVNNIFESGDKKVDADVAVDDMLDEFGIDRGAVDQKDILEAYDEAYKTLNVPPGSRGGPDDIAEPVQSAKESTGNLVSRQIKIMNAAERIKPGLFENITEEQIDILVKYADRIDDDLLKNIVLDPDPNNRAAAVATLEQVDALMSEGKSMDEIMSILQSTPRTKQAEGGIAGILKL